MKKFTAIMPIVALLLSVAAPSVQAAPSPEMCQTLPKSEPWKNRPSHIWNVVWRNKVALCNLQTTLDRLESAKMQPASPQANQLAPAPTTPIAESIQPLPQNP